MCMLIMNNISIAIIIAIFNIIIISYFIWIDCESFNAFDSGVYLYNWAGIDMWSAGIRPANIASA